MEGGNKESAANGITHSPLGEPKRREAGTTKRRIRKTPRFSISFPSGGARQGLAISPIVAAND